MYYSVEQYFVQDVVIDCFFKDPSRSNSSSIENISALLKSFAYLRGTVLLKQAHIHFNTK